MDKDSFHIRPAVAEDASAILAVHRMAVRGVSVAFYDPLIIEDWSPRRPSPERISILMEKLNAGEEVGLVALTPENTMVAYGCIVPAKSLLGAVYVHADYNRKGLGGRLLNELETLARNAGIIGLGMEASLNAERFYQKHGYKVEKRGEHILQTGRAMACIRMWKRL